ncbi:MAG: AMP-binding enzyme, partial [Actinomycetaceae bacterium]
KWGQAVTAFVVPSDPAVDPAEFVSALMHWCRNEAPLSQYKRPKRIHVIASIPKSPVGKILRRKLLAGEY